MQYGSNPYGDPVPEAPPPVGPTGVSRRIPRFAAAVGLASFLGLAGAGVAFAVGGSGSPSGSSSAAASPTTSTTVSDPAEPRGPGGFGKWLRPDKMMPGLGQIVHGQYTVHTPTGYETIEVRVGQVVGTPKAPSNGDGSITVKSEDGSTETYTLQKSTIIDSLVDGISNVGAGDQVRIEALRSGSKATAMNIVDTTKIGASRHGFGFARPGHPVPGMPGQPPVSTGQAGSAE